MAVRAGYTNDEWRLLEYAPLWVFSAVAGADSDIDKKEGAALAKELQEAHLYKNGLAREVLSSVLHGFSDIMPAYTADSRSIDEGLEDVASLLASKGETDAEGFKRAMLLLGKNIAESSGGGFLGIGSKVSDAEKRALVVVATSLRVEL